MARKERGRVFCIHPGDAPRRRIASRDSHHECLTTLSLCRYGRFNFFAIMTGSLFPRGDKVAGKILCYAPMAPSTFPLPPFPPPLVTPARLYARCACPRNVSLTLGYLFFQESGYRIWQITRFLKKSPSCFIYFFVYYGGRVVESFFLKNNSFFSSRFLHPTMKLQSKYTFSIDTLYLPIDKIVKCLSGLKFNRFNLLYRYFIHRLTFVYDQFFINGIISFFSYHFHITFQSIHYRK